MVLTTCADPGGDGRQEDRAASHTNRNGSLAGVRGPHNDPVLRSRLMTTNILVSIHYHPYWITNVIITLLIFYVVS